MSISDRISSCKLNGGELSLLISRHCAEFSPRDVATAFRRLLAESAEVSSEQGVKRCSVVVEDAAKTLEEAYVKMLPTMGSSEICSALHAIATARYRPATTSFLDLLEARAEQTARDAPFTDLANCLWAFATQQRKPSPSLMSPLEDRLVEVAPSAGPMDVGNALWSYAKLGSVPQQPVLEALQQKMRADAACFQPQVCVLAIAFTTSAALP